jgi:hypothetical protein
MKHKDSELCDQKLYILLNRLYTIYTTSMAPPTKCAREASDSDEDYREGSDDDFQGARRSIRPRYRAAKQTRGSARIGAITKKRKEQEATHEATRLVKTTDNEAQPFFRLPGEIRNAIYTLLVPNEDIPLMHDPYLPEYTMWEEVASGRALTQTCRQLRAEFLGIY